MVIRKTSSKPDSSSKFHDDKLWCCLFEIKIDIFTGHFVIIFNQIDLQIFPEEFQVQIKYIVGNFQFPKLRNVLNPFTNQCDNVKTFLLKEKQNDDFHNNVLKLFLAQCSPFGMNIMRQTFISIIIWSNDSFVWLWNSSIGSVCFSESSPFFIEAVLSVPSTVGDALGWNGDSSSKLSLIQSKEKTNS